MEKGARRKWCESCFPIVLSSEWMPRVATMSDLGKLPEYGFSNDLQADTGLLARRIATGCRLRFLTLVKPPPKIDSVFQTPFSEPMSV